MQNYIEQRAVDLQTAERTAQGIVDHQNNVAACNDGIRSCDHSRLPVTSRKIRSIGVCLAGLRRTHKTSRA